MPEVCVADFSVVRIIQQTLVYLPRPRILSSSSVTDSEAVGTTYFMSEADAVAAAEGDANAARAAELK